MYLLYHWNCSFLLMLIKILNQKLDLAILKMRIKF